MKYWHKKKEKKEKIMTLYEECAAIIAGTHKDFQTKRVPELPGAYTTETGALIKGMDLIIARLVRGTATDADIERLRAMQERRSELLLPIRAGMQFRPAYTVASLI